MEFLPFLMCAVFLVVPVLYWLVRKDGLAVEAVAIDVADFAAGRLPPICCKTGEAADVGATVKQQRWFRTAAEGIVPITNEQRNSFHGIKRINRRARMLGLAMFAAWIPLTLAQPSPPVELAFVLLFLAIVLIATVSNLRAHRCLAEPRRERDGSVTLRGVHPAFVAAVQESRPSTRPATMADTP